jgi:hypothetical protein
MRRTLNQRIAPGAADVPAHRFDGFRRRQVRIL